MTIAIDKRKKAIDMYRQGIAPTEIANTVGSTLQAVVMMARRAGCPPQSKMFAQCGHKSADARRRKKVQDNRNEINREMSALKKAAGLTKMQQWGRRKKNSDVFWQEPNLPDDTRTITGILMGDPLTGRSALDQRPPLPATRIGT